MEEQRNTEQLKTAFLRYLHSLRNTGSHVEPLALGAIVALVALRDEKDADLLRYFRSPETVNSMRKIVSKFENTILTFDNDSRNVYHILYDNIELHSFLYEARALLNDSYSEIIYLLDELYKQSIGRMGEYITPDSVAELMAALVRVDSDDGVLDPVFGSGGFLNAVQTKINAPFDFVGADKSAFNRVVVKLKSYLAPHVHYQEIPGSVIGFSKELPKFDVILSNPPIRKISRDEARYMYSDSLNGRFYQEMSLNFIELGLQHLKQEGRAAYLVSLGMLFLTGESEEARKSWLDRKLLTVVISLPPNLLPHTGLRCAILLFENNNADDSVKFVKADERYEASRRRQNIISTEDALQIDKWVNSDCSSDNVAQISYQEISENDYCLVPNEYLLAKQSNSTHLSEKWVKLGDIAEIMQGQPLSKLVEGSDLVVRGRDLRVARLDKESMARKDLSGYGKPLRTTKRNDILLQRIGSKPAAYLVAENEENIAVEDTVFIIRCYNISTNVLDFICQFLNSDQVSSRISNARNYSVIPTQTLKSIRALEVPLPEQKIIDLVKEMNALEASLKFEYEKAMGYKQALFDGYDPNDIGSSFEEARFTATALENALKQKDDITYRVRTQYPFPLAYAYRNIYLEREYAGVYERQMKYGEQLLSFLSAVGMCLCIKFCSNNNQSDVSTILKDYQSYIEKGISPGDLQATLQRTCKLLSSEERTVAQGFSQIWYKPGGKKESVFAKNSRDELVTKLNAYKHHRGPSNKYERKLEGEGQAKILESLLTHIEFISDWELIRINEIDKHWRSEELEYSASLLKGDHPAFEQIRFRSNSNLSLDKLYIKCRSDYVCLYPFISLAYNPNTRHEEIFTIDKSGKNGLALKSFESSTSIESEEVRSDFTYCIDKYENSMG